ncbi:phage baseplate assembly protein V [Aminobacterium sp. EBM-42]|jgi:phage baseplate assembly protein V|uniref:phage baseplate assembly protein V n=1 Tax=Aminobacterium sp. EBM-42 TaxID=1918503 RepID=UPI000AF9A683|nr:phage baseplate assembly protein V [Aminobacterium sp. EBM-42]
MFDYYQALMDIEERLNNILRVGTISSANAEEGTVRVLFRDKDSMVSYDLPVLVRQTLRNKDYFIPDVGEQVLCVFLPNGMEQGFCLGAMYNAKDKPTIGDPNKRRIDFEDGTWIEHDRSSGATTVHSTGDIVIESESHITLQAPRIDLNS